MYWPAATLLPLCGMPAYPKHERGGQIATRFPLVLAR